MLRSLRILNRRNKILFHRDIGSRSTKSFKFLPAPETASKSSGGGTPKVPASVELDKETLELLQNLSLVGFEKEEIIKIVQEAITFADKIFEVDTSKVKPLVTLLEDETLYLREDVPETDITREELLSNSKVTQENYFVSPIAKGEAELSFPQPQARKVSQD